MMTLSVHGQAVLCRWYAQILARILFAPGAVATTTITAYWAPLGGPWGWLDAVAMVALVTALPALLLAILALVERRHSIGYYVAALVLSAHIAVVVYAWAGQVGRWSGSADLLPFRLLISGAPTVTIIAGWLLWGGQRREPERQWPATPWKQ
ncbi:hypothetical protein OG271_03315 [Micromonospora rifamycinica]|uniref:hypothetical protein n=1 Tax=Micromonospora rifamycinica TaxID=291594 RepID=UPI002E2CA762|nr:hypothetical protein [Micromonospora rifamycinica]